MSFFFLEQCLSFDSTCLHFLYCTARGGTLMGQYEHSDNVIALYRVILESLIDQHGERPSSKSKRCVVYQEDKMDEIRQAVDAATSIWNKGIDFASIQDPQARLLRNS